MNFELIPLITEKSMSKVPDGTYTFSVPTFVNKKQIEEKIKELYKVKVASVNTLKIGGKIKRYRGHAGKRRDWKKTIVILEKGEQIKGFSEALSDKKETKKEQ